MGSVVFAFLLIMTAGGFIAYFGDRLGYVMGKKRVTLFGLRPRHTATTLTVIAGVLIGGFTLAFLLGVNQSFRIALLKGEQQIRENYRLKRSNVGLRVQANRYLAAALSSQHAAEAAISQTDTAKHGLSVAKKALSSAQQDLHTEQLLLTAKQTDLKKLTLSLADERSQLADVQGKLAARQKQLGDAVVRIKQDIVHRRGSGLIYRDYGELGRKVISASETPTQIRADLIAFLQRLSQLASARGAKVGDNGRAVEIASINDGGDWVNENGSLNALASVIHSHGEGSIVIIASAFGNSFVGDDVIVRLHPIANVLAIRAGTQIAQTTIAGGTSSVDEIASQLHQFLVTQVRPAAKRAGVIPVNNSLTGSEELGDISLPQIYDIVSQIRQVNGDAVVTARVANDVYSADQLKLIFTVKPGNPVVN